jgi:hypothetical protein
MWLGTQWKQLWENQSIFFRTAKMTPDDETMIDNSERTDGLQQDEFQYHSHSMPFYPWGTAGAGNNSGPYTMGSLATGGSGGTETRPVNRLMIIWQRYK